MALKGDHRILVDDVSFFMNEVSNRGSVVSFSTVGSGAALDQSAALVTVPAVGSGTIPVGVLMCDMVNIDQTRQHLNQHKFEVQKGGKVRIGNHGWIVTDQIASGLTLTVGDKAYLGTGGRITNVFSTTGGTVATPAVGRFLSKTDEDGYAKIYVNLP